MDIKKIVASQGFQWTIIGVIVFNAFLIGLDTYIDHALITSLEALCVWIFVVELAMKFYARKSVKAYFTDPWNVFDLIIVGSAFVPNVSAAATVLRVLRVFRILRLVNNLPELRLIVSVLVRSITSMTYIALLMFICFYIYAIMGHEFFGNTQWEYASLHEAFFSLFRSLTCEDWTDLRYDGLPHNNYWLVTIYHCTWIILGTFLLINLVVGAVINNYQESHEAERQRLHPGEDLDMRIAVLSKELNQLLTRKLEQA